MPKHLNKFQKIEANAREIARKQRKQNGRIRRTDTQACAAEKLGVSEETIRRALQDGRLAGLSDADLEAFSPSKDHRPEHAPKLLRMYLRRAKHQTGKLENAGIECEALQLHIQNALEEIDSLEEAVA